MANDEPDRRGLYVENAGKACDPLALEINLGDGRFLGAEIPEYMVVDILKRRGYIIHPPASVMTFDAHQVAS